MRDGKNILFLVGQEADYLADGLLHGLRMLYGAKVVDYPKCEPLYLNCPGQSFSRVRGHGFTLYKTLPDIEVDRYEVFERLRSGFFELVIFASIGRQYSLFVELYDWLNPDKTILLDGEDSQSIAPYNGRYWRKINCWLWPKAHSRFNYFKREWGPDSWYYRTFKLWPRLLEGGRHQLLGLHRISFSIPEEKIIKNLPVKNKDFPAHIVDQEVAARLDRAGISYQFSNEADYYKDLRQSRFGITTKRAGWDCLRHYEIAANGAVPCFRDLQLKPTSCAPSGLDDSNCISYSSVDELLCKVRNLSSAQYAELQKNTLSWVRSRTTVELAKYVLSVTIANVEKSI
jgi:hypothetical protein